MTIGIGHLVVDEAEARRLAQTHTFEIEIQGKIKSLANKTKQEIEALVVDGFRVVARNTTGVTPGVAKDFPPLTTIRLVQQSIIDLFDADVYRILHELTARKEFRDYATFPPEAKLALLDVAFTSGVAKILMPSADRGLPKMTAAICPRDWWNAGEKVMDSDLQDTLKDQIRAWYQAAARREPFYLRSSFH